MLFKNYEMLKCNFSDFNFRQKVEHDKYVRICVQNLNSLKLFQVKNLYSYLQKKFQTEKVFVLLQLLLANFRSQSSTSPTTNDHKGGSKFSGNVDQTQLLCIDRMQWCVNCEHRMDTYERKRKDKTEHNGFPMYCANAERNTGVKYLSLSSRDNARANWNLLGASSKKGVTSPSLRSQDRFTLILPTLQRVLYYSHFL